MRRTEGFDHRVPRGGSSFSLETLLEHRFVVCFRRAQRVSAFQLVSEGITDKTGCGFKSAVEKDSSGDRFKHVRQQCILLAPTTLLFATSKTEKIAEVQFLRGLCESRRTDESMLHARQLAFSTAGIRTAQIVCYDQSQNRVTEELERFVVQFASFELVAGRNFLMRPRAVRDGPFEQRAIVEFVSENRFEEIEIGNRFGIFQNRRNYKQTPEACLKTELPHKKSTRK